LFLGRIQHPKYAFEFLSEVEIGNLDITMDEVLLAFSKVKLHQPITLIRRIG